VHVVAEFAPRFGSQGSDEQRQRVQHLTSLATSLGIQFVNRVSHFHQHAYVRILTRKRNVPT
jgi:hypothetical protein